MTDTRRTTRPAFTLIELLVVVAIIVALLGIGIAGMSNIRSSAKNQATENTMAQARAVVTEYEIQTKGKNVNHLGSGIVDWSGNKSWNNEDHPGYPGTGSLGISNPSDFQEHAIERFVWATYQVPVIQEQYKGMSSDAFVDYGETDEDLGNGFYELRDGWGNKLVYAEKVEYGNNSEDDFLPEHPNPFFASPGPDGQWGSANPGASAENKRQAADNIYSFELNG